MSGFLKDFYVSLPGRIYHFTPSLMFAIVYVRKREAQQTEKSKGSESHSSGAWRRTFISRP